MTVLPTKITIRKNGNPISFPKEYYNGVETRVTSSNNGDKYECEVDNRFYSRTSDTVAVNVHCKFKRVNELVLKWVLFIYGIHVWVVMQVQKVKKSTR